MTLHKFAPRITIPGGRDVLLYPTATGLCVHAELPASSYHTGARVSHRQMKALSLARHHWHGGWNYTLRPEAYDQISSAPDPFDRPSPDLAWLAHPVLTGLPAPDWDALVTALLTLRDQRREASPDKRRGHRPRAGEVVRSGLDDVSGLAQELADIADALVDRFGPDAEQGGDGDRGRCISSGSGGVTAQEA